jgi:2'-5' RNA ligase
MTADRWRCFVAVPVPEAVRAPILDAVERWRRRPDLAGLRWVSEERWHLTLAFLGAITPDAAAQAAAVVDVVASRTTAQLVEVDGVGGFPSAGAASVAWLGVRDPDGALGGAASAVGAALGLEATRFHPHVTLARARSRPVDLRPWIAQARTDVPRAVLPIDRVELIRSHLGAEPRYETLHSAPLRAATHA